MKEPTQKQITVSLTERKVKAVDTAKAMMRKSKAQDLKIMLLLEKKAANDSNYKR